MEDKQRYAAVAKLKDRSAVRRVELSLSGDEEKFKALEQEAQKQLEKLSSGVAEACIGANEENDGSPTINGRTDYRMILNMSC